MTKPITPDDIAKVKFPDEVVVVFNNYIIKAWDGKKACIDQEDIINGIINAFSTTNDPIDKEHIYQNHWLDIEELYGEFGWKVVYQKGDYGSKSVFIFERKETK
jgi:hypothetical protein